MLILTSTQPRAPPPPKKKKSYSNKTVSGALIPFETLSHFLDVCVFLLKEGTKTYQVL